MSLGLAMLLVLPRFLDLSRVSSWIPSYYYINYYRFGFIRRAFIGTLLTPLNMNSALDVRLFALLAFTAGLAVFAILFWSLFSKSLVSLASLTLRVRWLLALVFTLSPAIFLHFAYDAGRTDIFWLSCCIAAMLLVLSKQFAFRLKWLGVLFLSLVSLLIYEGSIFFLVPLYVVVLERIDRNNGLRGSLSYAFLMALFTFAVQYFGAFEEGSEVLADRLSAMAPGLGDPFSIVLTSDLVKDNISYSLGLRFNWFGNNPIVFIYVFAWCLILFRLIRFSSDPVRAGLLLVAPFFGLFLNLIALDYIRYLSLALTLSAVSVLGLLVFDSVAVMGLRGQGPLLALLVLGCVAGPFGIVPDDALPLNPLS